MNNERPRSDQVHLESYKIICDSNFFVDPDTSCGITHSLPLLRKEARPISLLKCESLPYNFEVIKSLEIDCIFSGINSIKLELYYFGIEFFINGSAFNLYVFMLYKGTLRW